MPQQQIFRDNFLSKLRSELSINVGSYRNDREWVSAYAAGEASSIQSRLESLDDLELLVPEDGELHDLENTKRVFLRLQALNRAQATDPRLWTYLTHITFWKYMRRRWNLTASRSQKPIEYVLERYFVKSEQSRALSRNGIARLWWYGYLTYDEARADPFELTTVLLKQLDIAQQVLERSLGRNRNILHGFLDYLLRNPQLVEGGNAGRSGIRELAAKLNLYGGFCLLDCLSQEEIVQRLEEIRLRSKNSVATVRQAS